MHTNLWNIKMNYLNAVMSNEVKKYKILNHNYSTIYDSVAKHKMIVVKSESSYFRLNPNYLYHSHLLRFEYSTKPTDTLVLLDCARDIVYSVVLNDFINAFGIKKTISYKTIEKNLGIFKKYTTNFNH